MRRANVADVIGRWSSERPDATAVIEGKRQLSYRQFDSAVWRAAAELKLRGVRPGDVVGLSLPSSSLHLVAVYALARLGAVQISLPPDQPLLLRQSLIRQFHVAFVLGPEGEPGSSAVPILPANPAWLEPGPQPSDRGIRSESGAAGWRIVLSSGTTRAPKGVLFTHEMEAGWQSRVHSTMGSSENARFIQLIGMPFCYGLRLCMTALQEGATVVVPDPRVPTVASLTQHRITHIATVPHHLQLLVSALARKDQPRLRLQEVTVAGAVMPESLRALVRQRLTPNLHVKYGSNEVGYLTAAPPELQVRFPETIGFPVPAVDLEVVDNQGRPLPPGEIGHIRARGEHFPTGYIGQPEISQERFRDGWFYPGDLAQRNLEGAVFFKGRADDLMNFNGMKIVPSDIESVLLQHPAVAEAAAFPLPSSLHQDVPAAAVVLGRACSVEELLAHCRDHLGERGPYVISIVPQLPRSAAGKVLKRELASRMTAAATRSRRSARGAKSGRNEKP